MRWKYRGVRYHIQSHVSAFGTPILSWPTDRSISALSSLNSTLLWKEHTASILQKASRILGVLRRLRCSLTTAALRKIYVCYIHPILEYASVAWGNVSRNEADQLERFQRRAACLILGLPLFARVNHSELLLRTACLPLSHGEDLRLQYWDTSCSQGTFQATSRSAGEPCARAEKNLGRGRFSKFSHSAKYA